MIELDHLQHFRDIKGFFTGDKKTKEYFKKNYLNNTAEEVYIKLSSFSVPYLDNLKAGKNELASFIASLGLEQLMREGNPEAVKKMKSFVVKEEEEEFLDFASTYCNWHNQDSFPIYSADALILLNSLIDDPQGFKQSSYLEFANALTIFRKDNKLEKLNFKELDKFIWLYAKHTKLIID
jgi:hypothetical protein